MTTFSHHYFASNYFGIIYNNEQWMQLLNHERKSMDMCNLGNNQFIDDKKCA